MESKSYRWYDPDWLEFDLIYIRYITRVEVVLFRYEDWKKSQNMSPSKLRFSVDKRSWRGIKVRQFDDNSFTLLPVNMKVRGHCPYNLFFFFLDRVYVIIGVTRLGMQPGLLGSLTLSAGCTGLTMG